MAAGAPILDIDRVSKAFGANWVLDRFSMSIADGEFVSLLGPSGCGKTTLLRTISGFVEPDKGDIVIRGASMRSVPPYRRNLGMVFQNYSLWPHMTVGDNVGFGLETRGIARRERRDRVRNALALVGLEEMAERMPGQLSGGQRQRVALARAIVYEPDILLLDEPLSALDRKLRERMQVDLRVLQQRLGITTILVTHDQDEALLLSDRIAVMEGGRLVQQGNPLDIYKSPRSAFVADFVGRMNTIEAVVERVDGRTATLRTAEGLAFRANLPDGDRLAIGQPVLAIIRPERISASQLRTADGLEAGIEGVSFLGPLAYLDCRLASGRKLLVALMQADADPPAVGGSLWLDWPDDAVRLVEKESESVKPKMGNQNDTGI